LLHRIGTRHLALGEPGRGTTPISTSRRRRSIQASSCQAKPSTVRQGRNGFGRQRLPNLPGESHSPDFWRIPSVDQMRAIRW
jgi:hypothetical protein